MPAILQAFVPALPKPAAAWVSRHVIAVYAISEDPPDPESRVVLNGTDIQLVRRRSNLEAHRRLTAKVKATFRAAGFPLVLSRLWVYARG